MMKFFQKKKLYKIVWRYDPWCHCHTEIVIAKDPAKAWKKIKREHGISIDLVLLEEVKYNEKERISFLDSRRHL